MLVWSHGFGTAWGWENKILGKPFLKLSNTWLFLVYCIATISYHSRFSPKNIWENYSKMFLKLLFWIEFVVVFFSCFFFFWSLWWIIFYTIIRHALYPLMYLHITKRSYFMNHSEKLNGKCDRCVFIQWNDYIFIYPFLQLFIQNHIKLNMILKLISMFRIFI